MSEFYAFASTPEHPEAIHAYLNHLDVLENFCLHFKERASSLLQLAEQNKIILPFHHQETDPYHHMTPESPNRLLLSKRETDCAVLLLKGLTAKEIATHLVLSYRTIEDYIHSLKQKFRARNKGDLILKLLDCGIKG